MKHSHTTFQVLLAISVGLLDGVIEIVETGYLMGKRPEFKWNYKKFEGLEKTELVKKLYSLNRQGLIEKTEDRYFLTKRGRARFTELDVHFSLNLPTNIPWKGTWYLVMFDIPERCRVDRDRLRYICKSLSLIRLQKSIYVYPHNIQTHLNCLKKLFPKRQLLVIQTKSPEITKLVYSRFKEDKIII